MDSVKRKESDFLEDVASLKNLNSFPESLISRVKFLPRAELKFECLLDELMFYQALTGYPQVLINFLLKLLPNYEFKVIRV
jgi:phenylalanyl-tRNA synthetase beta subunit